MGARGNEKRKGARRPRGKRVEEKKPEEENAMTTKSVAERCKGRRRSAVGRGRRPIRNALCAFVSVCLKLRSKCPVAVVE